jgi:hypothetical protein
MKLLPHLADRGKSFVPILSGIALSLTMFVPFAGAQATEVVSKPSEAKLAPETVETLYITKATTQNDLNDVQTAVRNMVPRAKIYATPSQNAIVTRANAEDMQFAKKLIADLDRPRKAYRITYTLAEMDNGKRVGEQHLALLVVAGGKSALKHGNRVPIITGMLGKDSAAQSSQVQYLDVGLNIEASMDGERLRSKVEETSVSDEKSGVGAQDPIVRQTVVEGMSDMVPGKSFVLGSLDVPGSTRHQEIAVTAELVQ